MLLLKAKDGVISQREAARWMGGTDRWVRKLLKVFLWEYVQRRTRFRGMNTLNLMTTEW